MGITWLLWSWHDYPIWSWRRFLSNLETWSFKWIIGCRQNMVVIARNSDHGTSHWFYRIIIRSASRGLTLVLEFVLNFREFHSQNYTDVLFYRYNIHFYKWELVFMYIRLYHRLILTPHTYTPVIVNEWRLRESGGLSICHSSSGTSM